MSHLPGRAAAPEPATPSRQPGAQQPIRHRLSIWPLTPPQETGQRIPRACRPYGVLRSVITLNRTRQARQSM